MSKLFVTEGSNFCKQRISDIGCRPLSQLSEPFRFYEKRMRSKRLINILELILHSKNHRSGAKVFHNTLAPVEFIQNCALARNW